MRLKLMALFLIILMVCLYAIYWKVDRDFFADKISFNENQSRSQLAALTRAVESELEGLTQVLDLAFPTLLEAKHDYGSDQAYSKFQMIARFSKVNGEIRIDPSFFLQGSSVASWGANYSFLALKSLADLEKGAQVLLTILDPEKKPWFLFTTNSKVTGDQYVAILSSDFFQGILDRQKGQMGTFALVNASGQVFAHSTLEYIGKSLAEDPLVQQIVNGANVSGSGIFNGLQNEKVHGFFEKVSGSNLYITIATPIRLLMAERSQLKMRFVYMGLGLSLLGLCLILLLEPTAVPASTSMPTSATPAAKPTIEKTNPPPIPPAVVSKPAAASPSSGPKVPPPPLSAPRAADAKFDSIFSEKKIDDAFATIDSLEAAPPPPPSDLTGKTSGHVEINQAPPPPPPPPQNIVQSNAGRSINWSEETAVPSFDLPERTSKLDEVTVTIRKPKPTAPRGMA